MERREPIKIAEVSSQTLKPLSTGAGCMTLRSSGPFAYLHWNSNCFYQGFHVIRFWAQINLIALVALKALIMFPVLGCIWAYILCSHGNPTEQRWASRCYRNVQNEPQSCHEVSAFFWNRGSILASLMNYSHLHTLLTSCMFMLNILIWPNEFLRCEVVVEDLFESFCWLLLQ